jgi:hypothetical protein
VPVFEQTHPGRPLSLDESQKQRSASAMNPKGRQARIKIFADSNP